MLDIATNILPIFLLIILGNFLKRSGLIGEGFWTPAEKLTYYILLPALIIRSIIQADLTNIPIGAMTLVILLLGTTMIMLALFIKPLLRIDKNVIDHVGI